jgi:hypothetical protein
VRDEYLIITGVNAKENPGNNTFCKTPAATIMPQYIIPFPYNCYVVFFVDRFVFRTNGDAPARHDFYTFLN